MYIMIKIVGRIEERGQFTNIHIMNFRILEKSLESTRARDSDEVLKEINVYGPFKKSTVFCFAPEKMKEKN
jgi:hypothetical protein